MNTSTLILTILCLALFSYWFGLRRAIKIAGGVASGSGGIKKLASLPRQYGQLTAIWCGLPAIFLLVVWNVFEPSVIEALLLTTLPQSIQSPGQGNLSLYLNDIYVLAESETSVVLLEMAAQGEKFQAAWYVQQLQSNAKTLRTALVLLIGLAGVAFITNRFTLQFSSRKSVERILERVLIACSGIAILTTIGIVLSVLVESIQFFNAVPPWDFLFGTQWSPQVAMRSDQVGSSGAFGAVPLFAGTMLITLIAMTIAVPVGLMIAIYLSEYASSTLRSFAKPMLELLAGVPTVVYGFFAALTVAPIIRDLGEGIGLSVASESALAAGSVMGVMIIPFVSSLSDDAISAVPNSLREGSLGMGATRSETIKLVLLPAALPGIVGAILLAVSRAVGETMIVVMAAGMAANLTANPLQSVTTVTVQIVALLTGDQEFDSPKTLAAFALGLMLFVTTLILNVVALKVVRKYREQYD